jgi:two-component system response regulator RegX3
MKFNCLIVDDESTLAENTCNYFKMYGVKTAWVEDSEGCISFLRDNDADLILLDMNLEKSSGFDLCRQLRKITNVPIFFAGARMSNEDIIHAFDIGGDSYIQKPYTLSVLLAKVKVAIKRQLDMKNSG